MYDVQLGNETYTIMANNSGVNFTRVQVLVTQLALNQVLPLSASVLSAYGENITIAVNAIGVVGTNALLSSLVTTPPPTNINQARIFLFCVMQFYGVDFRYLK